MNNRRELVHQFSDERERIKNLVENKTRKRKRK